MVALRRNLDLWSTGYKHVILHGNLNVETKEPCMQSFLELYVLRNLILDPILYKDPKKPSTIDLILINSSTSFQNSSAVEAVLSDFHKMTIMVVKATFQKLKPHLIYYQDYSMFSNDRFREKPLPKASVENISKTINGLENFLQIYIGVIDKLAPQKKKK